MSYWSPFPTDRLLAEVSLWSADFTCLKDEIERIDPFTDLYHIDVTDAHFVPGLLLFPDLVAALRPLTTRPFHVHLMTENPLGLIDDFAEAGANLISVHCENGPLAPAALQKIHRHGLASGLALGLDVPLDSVVPYLEMVDVIVLMGTPIGVKGAGLNPQACPRIAALRAILDEQGLSERIKIEADGGIRQNTVPQLRAAGAGLIVMGSLAFKSSNLSGTFDWVRSLPVYSA